MAIVMSLWGIISFILAIFVPPLGVVMHNGCGKDFIITILLTILGYVPGICYAVFVIMTTPATVFGI